MKKGKNNNKNKIFIVKSGEKVTDINKNYSCCKKTQRRAVAY